MRVGAGADRWWPRSRPLPAPLQDASHSGSQGVADDPPRARTTTAPRCCRSAPAPAGGPTRPGAVDRVHRRPRRPADRHDQAGRRHDFTVMVPPEVSTATPGPAGGPRPGSARTRGVDGGRAPAAGRSPPGLAGSDPPGRPSVGGLTASRASVGIRAPFSSAEQPVPGVGTTGTAGPAGRPTTQVKNRARRPVRVPPRGRPPGCPRPNAATGNAAPTQGRGLGGDMPRLQARSAPGRSGCTGYRRGRGEGDGPVRARPGRGSSRPAWRTQLGHRLPRLGIGGQAGGKGVEEGHAPVPGWPTARAR